MNCEKLILLLSAVLLLSQVFECRPYLERQRSKRQALETYSSQNYRNNVQSVSASNASKERLRRSNSKKRATKKEWQWAYMLPSSVVIPRMDVAPEP